MQNIYQYIIEKLHISNGMTTKGSKDPYDARNYEVGDIICAVYQYNSRHVHFFKIKKLTGKATVEMIELSKRRVSGDWQNGSCVPDDNDEIGEILKARINNKGRLKFNDFFCYLWNGQPEDYYTD